MSALDPFRLALRLRSTPDVGVFCSPGYNAPLFGPVPFVFSVHDLNHLDRPENSSLIKRVYYATVLKSACRRAAAILTVSNFSHQRIVDWSGVDGHKVFNVGNGVDQAYMPEGPAHSPGYDYLLMVGNRKLHKNELRVVAAFAKATLNPSLQLLFTGRSSPQLQLVIDQHRLSDRVHFTGFVQEADLPSLYRGAVALIFPSLYEGFGLPVVEAFACGTPVVTSSTTSLPEVAGGAALLVDPLSVDDLAHAMSRVVTDLALRGRLRAHGLQRAQAFRWPDVVARVRRVLSAVEQGCRTGQPGWPGDDARRVPLSSHPGRAH